MNNDIENYSDPIVAQEKAYKYLGKDAHLHYSTRPSKKYMIYDPNNDLWVHFGTMKPPMEDATKHQDLERRRRYLARATKIKGNWKENPYSPNNLSINILW